MISRKLYKHIVRQITEALSNQLAGHEFDSKPTLLKFGKFHTTTWCRDLTWKLDTLVLIHNGQYEESVELALGVEFPIPNVFEADNIHLDGKPVGYLAGKRYSGYDVPCFFTGVLLGWRTRGCIRKILRDVTKALTWFDELDTPEKCLQHLAGGMTVHGDTQGHDVVKMREYLRSLDEKGDRT